jgi:hypothetical protein
VAQLGSAFAWGAKGRWFKSSHADQSQKIFPLKISNMRFVTRLQKQTRAKAELIFRGYIFWELLSLFLNKRM